MGKVELLPHRKIGNSDWLLAHSELSYVSLKYACSTETLPRDSRAIEGDQAKPAPTLRLRQRDETRPWRMKGVAFSATLFDWNARYKVPA